MAFNGDDATGAAKYHWDCPVCGKSGLVDATSQREAREPLIRHLRYTDGEGHAPHDALPEAMDIHAMDEYVERAG